MAYFDIQRAHLAFEMGFERADDLFRVISTKNFNGRSIERRTWFATLEAAQEHARHVNMSDDELVLEIAEYKLVKTHGLDST